MPKPNDLGLAARFVAVLYAATHSRPGVFRRIDDCAEHAGITRPADLKRGGDRRGRRLHRCARR